jgi:hypothetical protein
LSGALTATVIPTVAKDNMHPSTSSGQITVERHSVVAAIVAGIGESKNGGKNPRSLRIKSWRRIM